MLVLLAFLGIPIWFLAGVVVLMFLRKRAIENTPGAFPCKVRRAPQRADLAGAKWHGVTGRWERDVFVVSDRRSLTGFSVDAVDEFFGDDAWSPDPGEIKRMGNDATVLPMRLASGSFIEIAVPDTLRTTAAGPFLTPNTDKTTNDNTSAGAHNQETVGKNFLLIDASRGEAHAEPVPGLAGNPETSPHAKLIDS